MGSSRDEDRGCGGECGGYGESSFFAAGEGEGLASGRWVRRRRVREPVGAGGEVVFVEGFAGECGESAGREFEFFTYGSADELVFGFLKT